MRWIMRGSNTDRSEAGGEPPIDNPPVDCRSVRGMLEAGLPRLTEEALLELTGHLDVCEPCSTIFDAIGAHAPRDDRSSDIGQSVQPVDLLSKWTREVVRESERELSPQLTLVQSRPSTSNRSTSHDYDGQLAPGQILQGGKYRFL